MNSHYVHGCYGVISLVVLFLLSLLMLCFFKEKFEHIFSMPKRLYTHEEGSGIGLYIVKRIIGNAGCSIKVISEVRKGAEFQLYINEWA
jgi:K+-sensing histidine kinase KdpD